jgi:hypothetical protein
VRKLREDRSSSMLAAVRSTVFCVPVCYQKNEILKYTELEFCLLFYMGVQHGPSHLAHRRKAYVQGVREAGAERVMRAEEGGDSSGLQKTA